MTQWKAAGRARRDVEDALWARFRAAQDTFFSARSEVFAARDADLATNLEKKRALLVEAEALLPRDRPRAARAALRSVHERWEAAGHVPRAARDESRAGCARSTTPSARPRSPSGRGPTRRRAARAEATVAQLRHQIASLEKEAEAARAAGNAKKADEAEAAAEARRSWLVEAEKTLAEFS